MIKKPLHIAFVVHEYLPTYEHPEDFLQAIHSLQGWAKALLVAGCKVSAICRFSKDDRLSEEGVDYYFVADSFSEALRPWQLPRRLHQQVKALQPDVVHTHNMNKVLQHAHLRWLLPATIPIVLQNHAEWPAGNLRIRLQRWLLPKLSAFLFCAEGQELSWQKAGILPTDAAIHFVMEGSTHFKLRDQRQAQQLIGLYGAPVFLWVGHLNNNKDPLTVLKAFARFCQKIPSARLYMIFRERNLLTEVHQLLQQHSYLKDVVYLLGERPHHTLEHYYNAADYFVLGSHREGSGYSLLEAIACGCIPVVTDIPSFRMITNNGQLGALWSVGDSEACYQALCQALAWGQVSRRQQLCDFFNQQLSYPAIARQMVLIYQQLYDSVRDSVRE